MEPIDSDKQKNAQKLKAFEVQQIALTERLSTFVKQIAEIQSDLYLLQQKMKVSSSTNKVKRISF